MFVLLLALALVLALKSVPMRHRAVARARAIRGTSESIPLSTIVAVSSDLPGPMAEPVILEWRARRAGRAPLHWALVFLNLVAAAGGLLVATPPHMSAPGGLPIEWPPTSSGVLIAGWVLIIPPSVALFILLKGRRAAVVATEEGVTRKPIFGRMKTAWWEDARLLEATGSGRDTFRSRRYALYGRRSTVWWDERLAPGSTLTWDGIDASEGESRS
jgi:hypothetical protein